MRLTSKMATQRLANSDNCKAFFSFNEGSGTTFTDKVTGAVFTDASATFTTNPHAPGINSTSLTDVSDGWITIPADGVFVFAVGYQTVTTGAFTKMQLGGATGIRMLFSADTYSIEDDDGTVISASALTAATNGQDSFSFILVDKTGGVAYVHEAINGGAATLKQTITASIPAAKITVPADGAISNSGRPEYYGTAVWTINSVPSEADRNAALDYIAKEWARGYKVLPPQFA